MNQSSSRRAPDRSVRRQIFMALLLALAVVGAAMRHWADNPSLARDIGTLLMVLWVPAVGNVIGFLVRRWHARKPKPPAGFDPARPFQAQLRVSLQPQSAAAAHIAAMTPGETRCALLVGSEAFTARLGRPLQSVLTGDDTAREVTLEFLRPEVGLPRFTPGMGFHLVVGNTAVATGQALEAVASS